MERFQEKCVFRGLLFYWYKVCIFNHTQSMRVINYIILTLKPWTRPLLHFHMVLPIKRASYFFSLCMKSFGVAIQMKATEQFVPVLLFYNVLQEGPN